VEDPSDAVNFGGAADAEISGELPRQATHGSHRPEYVRTAELRVAKAVKPRAAPAVQGQVRMSSYSPTSVRVIATLASASNAMAASCVAVVFVGHVVAMPLFFTLFGPIDT